MFSFRCKRVVKCYNQLRPVLQLKPPASTTHHLYLVSYSSEDARLCCAAAGQLSPGVTDSVTSASLTSNLTFSNLPVYTTALFTYSMSTVFRTRDMEIL